MQTHLGVVRFKQGRFKDGEIYLREALALDTENQMAAFNLGQTLLSLGRPREALVIFEQLHKLNSDYLGLDDAIKAAGRLDSDFKE